MRRDKVYLFTYDDLGGNKHITIRFLPSKNKQQKRCRWHEDFELSSKRLKKVFGYDVPDFELYYSKIQQSKIYTHVCQNCNKSFSNGNKNAKYCSCKCYNMVSRKCQRPSKEELSKLISQFSLRKVGRQFGVSDNAVKKWAKTYEII